MQINEIKKALSSKGYELVETSNLEDDITRLQGFNNSYNNLPIVTKGKITTVYELNRTNKTIYYFQNNDNIFEIRENIITGFEYLKNNKLRKINKTNFNVFLNGEKYSIKNFKVFLGII
jgi:hypothetical protein